MAKRRGPEIQIGGGARYSSQRIAERPAAAAPLRVHFDGSPSWPAIEIVDTWNGFPIPRVTRAVRDQIASWLEETDSDSAAEMRAIAARPDGSIVLRGFTFWDNRGRSAIDPAEEIAQLRRMATRPAAPSVSDEDLRAAVLLATGNGKLTERGNAMVNRGIAEALARGLVAYGQGRKAYTLTAKGRVFVAARPRPTVADLDLSPRDESLIPTLRAATSRTYYYLRQNDKTIGGPYLTIQKLATAARRKLGAGQQVDAKRLVAGQWADLTEGEAEAVAALL